MLGSIAKSREGLSAEVRGHRHKIFDGFPAPLANKLNEPQRRLSANLETTTSRYTRRKCACPPNTTVLWRRLSKLNERLERGGHCPGNAVDDTVPIFRQ